MSNDPGIVLSKWAILHQKLDCMWFVGASTMIFAGKGFYLINTNSKETARLLTLIPGNEYRLITLEDVKKIMLVNNGQQMLWTVWQEYEWQNKKPS